MQDQAPKHKVRKRPLRADGPRLHNLPRHAIHRLGASGGLVLLGRNLRLARNLTPVLLVVSMSATSPSAFIATCPAGVRSLFDSEVTTLLA